MKLVDNQEITLPKAEDDLRQLAAELIIANKELAFQNEEKAKRAAELFIANKELVFQNQENRETCGRADYCK